VPASYLPWSFRHLFEFDHRLQTNWLQAHCYDTPALIARQIHRLNLLRLVRSWGKTRKLLCKKLVRKKLVLLVLE